MLIALAAGSAQSLFLGGASRPRVERPLVDVGQSFPLGRVAFSLLPLAGSERRRTLQETVVRGRIWTHDQVQGLLHVNVPVRQTVVKLSPKAGGGLLVYNPVAPTGELIRLMRALEEEHGPVRHVVVGSLGLEHTALAGPCARCFPSATVWLQPGSWSFPISLRPELLGFPTGRLKTLAGQGDRAGGKAAGDGDSPPWVADFDIEVLGPLRFKSVGAFGETALLHKGTSTLLLTDTITRVDDEPPPILKEDERSLLYHARNSLAEEVDASAETLRRGWRRIVLFGLCFVPRDIEVRLLQLLSDRAQLPKSMEVLTQYPEGAVPFGVMPWRWVGDETESFRSLQGGGSSRGGLLVAPVLQALILNRFPDEVLDWVARVSRLRFNRIIPSHLANDVRASPRQFEAAFDFLYTPMPDAPRPAPMAGDYALLQAASDLTVKLGITQPPSKPTPRPSAAATSPKPRLGGWLGGVSPSAVGGGASPRRERAGRLRMSVLGPSAAEAALSAPADSDPSPADAADCAASVPAAANGHPAAPLPELPGLTAAQASREHEDGLYDLVMIALFRLAFGNAMGCGPTRKAWLNAPESYSALVDIASYLYRSLSSAEMRNDRVAAIFRSFPGPRDSDLTLFRTQLLSNNKLCNELLAQLSRVLFPFLVGTCHVEPWARGEEAGERDEAAARDASAHGDSISPASATAAAPEPWASKVVIERCRFLEASSCKGMCLGLCKAPSEAYFGSIGLPLSMTPNFEDGSCEMVWGRTPREEDLQGADLGCFGSCATRHERHAPPAPALRPPPLVVANATARTGACSAASGRVGVQRCE